HPGPRRAKATAVSTTTLFTSSYPIVAVPWETAVHSALPRHRVRTDWLILATTCSRTPAGLLLRFRLAPQGSLPGLRPGRAPGRKRWHTITASTARASRALVPGVGDDRL